MNDKGELRVGPPHITQTENKKEGKGKDKVTQDHLAMDYHNDTRIDGQPYKHVRHKTTTIIIQDVRDSNN